MPYSHPTLTTIKQTALTDILSANLGLTGSAPLQQSIIVQLAYAIAGLGFDLYGYVDWISQNSVPFTATGEFLAAWAALKGVYRIDASFATGTVAFAGTTGNTIPSGSLLTRSDNTQYATNSDYTIGTSSPVGFTAIIAAAAANAATGIALTLVTPITGVTAATTALTAIVGGADQETDASLRSRMLLAYQSPPNGGSAYDFEQWALQVPGVTRAWVPTLGVAPGSVLLYVMFDQTESAFNGFAQGTSGGATLETRIAAATGDQLLVANYIYPLRPVTALVAVFTPTPAPIAFTIQGLSPTNSTIEAGVSAALADLFVREGSPLAGNIIYLSDVNAAIESVAGIQHFDLVIPSTPISVATGSLPTVGAITYT